MNADNVRDDIVLLAQNLVQWDSVFNAYVITFGHSGIVYGSYESAIKHALLYVMMWELLCLPELLL